MANLQWDESLSVGVNLIDEQHKRWIQHLNDVSDAIESSEAPAQIAQTLAFLMDYTDTHFSTEETHMSRFEYPGMADHLRRHQELRDTLADLARDYQEEGATHPLAHAVNTLLANWLAAHIRSVDMQFGAFVREQGLRMQ